MTAEAGRAMPEYPPKPHAVEEAEFGSVLVLPDGRTVPTDVRPSRLAEAFAEYSSRSPAELLARRSLAVFADALQTTPGEWARISHLVRTSQAAEAVPRGHPSTWDVFREPYEAVLAKPHRVYGGLGQGLYTSHPSQFRADPNRPDPWRRALLSAPGGWLFETWVELQSGRVEIAAQEVPGHSVE